MEPNENPAPELPDPDDRNAIYSLLKRFYEKEPPLSEVEYDFVQTLFKDPDHWLGSGNSLFFNPDILLAETRGKIHDSTDRRDSRPNSSRSI